MAAIVAGAQTCGLPRNLANVLTMSVAYLCLFSAFQTTQTLAAALLGNLGTIAFGVLYCCFVGAGFVAPVVARYLGPVKGLVCGGATYVLFMLSYIYMVSPVVVLCGGLVGFGASVLWCSQGLMLPMSGPYLALTKLLASLAAIPIGGDGIGICQGKISKI